MTTQQTLPFEPQTDGVSQSLIEQIRARSPSPTATQVETAVEIIQRHLRKEARNRQLEMIGPEDLCPAQKRDMVSDLMRLFRE